MTVGYCFSTEGNAVELHLSGRRCSKGLLEYRRDAGYTFAFLGRLRYRGDLLKALHLDEACGLDDPGLVLEAYRRQGTDGLARLEGTFAVAIWDQAAGRLVGRRDLMGGFPLFWAQRGRRSVLGTSLRLVRSLVGAESPDPEYLADYQMMTCFSESEPESQRTAYLGVQRVLPGTLVQIDSVSGRIETQRHWDWLERLVDPGTDNVAEIAQGYRDRLRAAVRESIRGTTAAHLSGGMDSTSIALLALEAMEDGAAAGPLHTISLVYDHMRVLARERPLIESLARSQGGWQPHLIAADGMLNFDCYQSPPAHDEPWPSLSAAEIESARVAVAGEFGAATILTGQGADELLDTGPHHITDRLRAGRLGAAWSEACRCARAENCSVWTILGPFGVGNLLPLQLRDGLGPLAHRGFAPWSAMGETTIPPWVRPQFARRYRLRDRVLDRVHATYHGCRPTVLSVALSNVRARSGDFGRSYIATPRGILLEHPFLDSRLIRYSLGIHARIEPLPRTTPKPILGEAMRGVLPDEIRTRPKSGFFNEPYFRGLSKHLNELEDLVERAPRTADDWIDRRVLVECLRKGALGIGDRRIQMDRLNLTLSYLRWLSPREPESGAAKGDDEIIRLAVSGGEQERGGEQRNCEETPHVSFCPSAVLS